MKNRKSDHISKEALGAYLLCAPLLVLTVVFIAIPVFGALVTSTFRDVTFLPTEFIGVHNYLRLFRDPHFWQSVRFTFLFVFASVSFELVLGIILALILNESFRGRGPARVALLLPWAVPIAVAARIWQLIYNYDFGVLNYLVLQTGLADSPLNWLGTPGGAFAALVLSDVWKTTPFITIILLAGLSTIPQDLYRQAMVDGTHFFQRFFFVTLPQIRTVIAVALLFRTIDAIRIFDLAYVLTGGGPGGSTTPLSLYAYRLYLTGDFGAGSAVSVVVFVLSALLAVGYIRLGRFAQTLR